MSCIFVWLSTIQQSLSYLPQQALEMRYADVAALGTQRATSNDNFAIFPRPRLYMWSVSSDPAWITNFVKKKRKKSPKVSPFFSLSIQLGLYICSPSLILWYPKGISNQKSRNDDEVPVIAQSKCSTTWNVVRSFENPISATDKSRPPAP